MQRILLISVYTITVIAFGCGAKKSNSPSQGLESRVDTKFQYAEQFRKYEEGNYTVLEVLNPWDSTNLLAKYRLVSKGNALPEVDDQSVIIQTPVSSTILLSSPFIGMVSKLDQQQSIVGVGDKKYIYSEWVTSQLEKGQVLEVGSDHNLNVEQVIQLMPDYMMVSGMQEMNGNYEILNKAGVPVVYNVSWMESSPLGRAEWIKFIASFYELDDQADQLFDHIETEYLHTKEKFDSLSQSALVMVGAPYKGTWYTPSGGSYVGCLLRDAALKYPWIDREGAGSIPMSFEEVLKEEINADIWLNPSTVQTLDELLSRDERFSTFKAFKEGEVYNHNKRLSANGANDYWESGVINPHLILKDYLKIAHPHLMADEEFTYYHKLK